MGKVLVSLARQPFYEVLDEILPGGISGEEAERLAKVVREEVRGALCDGLLREGQAALRERLVPLSALATDEQARSAFRALLVELGEEGSESYRRAEAAVTALRALSTRSERDGEQLLAFAHSVGIIAPMPGEEGPHLVQLVYRRLEVDTDEVRAALAAFAEERGLADVRFSVAVYE